MEDILMTAKEADRFYVLKQYQEKKLKLGQVANLLNLSYRQTKRVWKRFREEGKKGIVSRKRNRKSNRALSPAAKKTIIQLIQENYRDFGPTLASEKLLERHSIKVSRETVRQLMIEAGLRQSKTSKKRIHPRRAPRPCEGELVQVDASDHDWLEGRGPRCHLHLAVDDATSKIKGAYFTEEETTEGYIRALQPYFEGEGLPRAIYCDLRGTFKVNHKNCEENRTQLGRAMKDLGIRIIYAYSPQAKGRVERANGILQDRLLREMRLEKISTLEEANRFLPGFIEKYNEKFGKKPTSTFNAHRPLNKKTDLRYILCIKEQRKVSKNLEISYDNNIYQLVVDRKLRSRLQGVDVDVLTTLENEMLIQFEGNFVKFKRFDKTATENVPLAKTKAAKKWVEKESKNRKPGSEHPWSQAGRYEAERKRVVGRRPQPKQERERAKRLEKRRKQSRLDNLEILASMSDTVL